MHRIYTIIDPQGILFKYKKIKHLKYKYEVVEYYSCQLKFILGYTVTDRYFSITDSGFLTVLPGYKWDGASGPTIDTRNTVRASCVHDVLYQCMRCRYLPQLVKNASDKELSRIMKEDWKPKTIAAHWWNSIRSGYFYWGVRLFGAGACKPNEEFVH